MNTVRFGEGKAYHITSKKLYEGLLTQLEKRWNIQPFTAPFKYDAKKITKLNIKDLRKAEYLVRICTIGTKYYIYFTVYNSKKYIILISPKNEKIYMLKNTFHSSDEDTKSLFTDTIIKTELTKSKDDKWHLLADDVIVRHGDDLRNVNYIDRLKYLFKYEDIFKKSFAGVVIYDTTLVTECQSLQHLISKVIPTSKYTIINIIFQPKYAKYGGSSLVYNIKEEDITQKTSSLDKFIHTNSTEMSKIIEEPAKNIYANFEVNMTSRTEVYQLYAYNNDKKLVNNGLAYISDIEHSKMLVDIFKKVKPMSIKDYPDLYELKTVMKCEYIPKFNKWKPIKITNKPISSTATAVTAITASFTK